ncbi:hypothetical protein RJ640_015149 [Escallonia rubra]|uniref:Reverse transcriptase/retrotransposon-derived protein RNase H-like domain-containing protein n=1 Tax=Escallonia rubra TaxID=112253 RepID=A0AA88U4D8_9ASTE|nr:hypothetical protein RJ640_015149 [Escallonia rubra]
MTPISLRNRKSSALTESSSKNVRRDFGLALGGAVGGRMKVTTPLRCVTSTTGSGPLQLPSPGPPAGPRTKDFYQDLYKDTKVLYQRLQKNPQPWTIVHTQAIRRIKLRAKTLPCLCLPLPEAFKIVEIDASDTGYGGILKQRIDGKMTPPRASFQKSGKGLLPRPNRYNLRKSIGSSSSQPSREAMLGRFENSGYNAHAHCPDIIQIEDEE